jgi:predicted site-specific integrase-resolvase
MSTQNARVTRVEAAELAGVDPRTINRWSAAGLLTVVRDPSFRRPATYDREEVLRVAAGMRSRSPEPDSSD